MQQQEDKYKHIPWFQGRLKGKVYLLVAQTLFANNSYASKSQLTGQILGLKENALLPSN